MLFMDYSFAATAVFVVNINSWLHIVAKDVEADPKSVVFDREGFYLDPGAQKVIAFVDGGYSVHDVVAGFLHIISYFVFIREHAFYVQVSGSCDEVFFVGVLACELIAYEVASVILS